MIEKIFLQCIGDDDDSNAVGDASVSASIHSGSYGNKNNKKTEEEKYILNCLT